MPDYKELGASLWKMGNIIDFTTFAGSRPPEKPFIIEPEDNSSFSDIFKVEPYVPEGEFFLAKGTPCGCSLY